MFSALLLTADIAQHSRYARFVLKADINCRDCDVRSLAGPEPDRQVFAKFKDFLRKAAAVRVEIAVLDPSFKSAVERSLARGLADI